MDVDCLDGANVRVDGVERGEEAMMLIIDGNNTAYRALYTVQLSHRGEDTSILFGVVRMIHTLVKKHRPRSVVVCFDGGTPPFRRQLVPTYKTGREKSDEIDWENVHFQINLLREHLLPVHGVLTIQRKHCEADDLMYHASRMACDRPYIVTTDTDLLQAVDLRTAVYNPVKGKIYTTDNFSKEIGVPWQMFLDYKVLVGDSSDNIPGVPNIGEKTAARLANFNLGCNDWPGEWELDVLNVRQRQSLDAFGIDNWWNARDCMDLSVDRCGAHKSIEDAKWSPADKGKIQRALFRYGFQSLLELGAEYTGAFAKLEQPRFQMLRHPTIPLFEREAMT